MIPDRFYRRWEVAAMFGVADVTVSRWSREGYLARISVPGSRPRIPGSAIIALIRWCIGETYELPGGGQ
ncbi:hypothetical protein C1I98_24670 [Spongiactinospora gelatinilytica]|uniref:Uncharacterized protein n=1 Tax=Spongiactinospora gelatinilytica TaxID=2666298 RepID=A0A2W2HGG7_9ACTN|nr:hypothetical protein [Spongiactinospora gelatinilytica]PZG38104.1 hypothetical protein C1I98_24670 [Spongiactinospora gelatinilytica]